MSHKFFRRNTKLSLLLGVILVLAACASPTGVGTTQPSVSDLAATIVAVTMQALPSNMPAASTPEPPAVLLPHTLYYLSNDGIYRRDNRILLLQVYRMERDGKTITQMTNEPSGVDSYDVSPVDGTVAYITDNQLVLVNADGSNRRVLVDGGSARQDNDTRFFKDPLLNPVFSPDGQTIAYSQQPQRYRQRQQQYCSRQPQHPRARLCSSPALPTAVPAVCNRPNRCQGLMHFTIKREKILCRSNGDISVR